MVCDARVGLSRCVVAGGGGHGVVVTGAGEVRAVGCVVQGVLGAGVVMAGEKGGGGRGRRGRRKMEWLGGVGG